MGHSGSTLLDLMLGTHSRIESVGEIINLNKYTDITSTKTDKSCTCGTPLNSCEYWSKIKKNLRFNNLGMINQKKYFQENNSELIKAILRITGKEIFCDSSKNIQRLENYLSCNFFDVTIVHLIRDGRAVAYSYNNKLQRLLNECKTTNIALDELIVANYKNKKSYNFKSAIKLWKQYNRKISKMYSKMANYLLIRYEDFVLNPEREISRILSNLGLIYEQSQLNFDEYQHHNISGNRMRFLDKQEISRDIKYLENLSFFRWWFATIYLASDLCHYKYRLLRN